MTLVKHAIRQKTRLWFGTVWLEEDLMSIQQLKTEYLLISADDETEEGQKHWHVLIRFENQHYMPATKNTHWEPVKIFSQAYKYIMEKGEPLIEKGTIPYDKKDRLIWEEFVQACKRSTPKEMIDGPFSKIYASHMGFYGQVHIQYRATPILDGMLENEWWWGPAGTGKTSRAFNEYPDCYVKPMSKWWDGYNDQEIILLDDWSPDHSVLVNHLKRWADRYPFPAEIKGSMMLIRPRKIIVTSNYPIERCFEREEDQEALARRFKVTRFHGEDWYKNRMMRFQLKKEIAKRNKDGSA